ncbi:Calx-beta domain-containing protein [Vacuolonema iberomarrocanum]|uniref:beta strand repeat-containing protein n=1 Tax=Vacuolonema iberomarrocanum TaxID=3454632 RepID=UPI0019F88759|nr:hypothetical protein [filamentous cyanobacterium LEGE 07170]
MATTAQSNAVTGGETLELTSLVSPANTPTPIVEITASDPEASEAGSNPAVFTITRSGGDLTQPLSIFYIVTGEASSGVDYEPLARPVIIPANESSVDLVVTPIDDDVVENTERLNLFLSGGANYDLGPSSFATITIEDDDLLPTTPTVSIAPGSLSVEEGDSGSFTIARTGATTESLQVTISLDPGAGLTAEDFALDGDNILAVTTTQIELIIPEGAANTSLTFSAESDVFAEAVESLTLTVEETAAYDVSATAGSAIASIAESAAILPTVSITPDSGLVDEGESTNLTVTRTGDTSEDLFVNISLDPGAGLTAEDYSLGGNVLVVTDNLIRVLIPAGQASSDITFTAESDALAEPLESLGLAIVDADAYEVDANADAATASIAPSDAIIPTGSITIILDADVADGTDFDFAGDLGTFILDDATPDDGDAFGSQILFDEVPVGTYTIQILPEGGFSLSAIDVTAVDGSANIPGGSATVNLTEAEAAVITFTSQQIVPEDIDYAIAATALQVTEGDAGETPITFTITRSGTTTDTSSVEFTLAGDAVLGEDYSFDPTTDVTGTGITVPEDAGVFTVTFAPDSTEATLTLNVTGDTVIEPDETVLVQLQNGTAPNGSATISTPDAVTTILNDDEPVVAQDIDYAVTTDTDSLSEGDSGSQTISFTISRTGATDVASQVELALGGNAELGSDFEFVGITGATLSGDPLNATIEFAAGETTAILTFSVLGDTIVEPDETLVATLANGTAPDNVTISAPSATTTILNDDEPVAAQDIDYAVTTDTDSLSEGDSGSQTISFTISRTGATNVASQVELALGGSAGLGTDFEFVGITGATLSGDPLNSTIEFAAGETTATLTFSVLGDTIVEPDETLIATLSNGTAPDNATISTPSATTTILDDDEPTLPDAGPILNLSDEVGSVPVAFQITREAALENVIQFYEIDDNQGTVAGLAPGDDGYTEAALGRLVSGVELIGPDRSTTTQTFILEGGALYAPVLFTHGDRGRPLFAFNEANPGNSVQIRSPEPNVFQFEDLVGGDDDFNDLIVEAAVLSTDTSDAVAASSFSSLIPGIDSLLDVVNLDLDSLPDLDDLLDSDLLPDLGNLPDLDPLLDIFDLDLGSLLELGDLLDSDLLPDLGDLPDLDPLLDIFDLDLGSLLELGDLLDSDALPDISDLPGIDELTGLAEIGAELVQQALTEAGIDGVLYFYATDDALGQVDGLSPLNPAYEDAVLNNIISEVTLADLVTQPLSVELPSETNYGVALALNSEPDNLYTVQDLLTLDASIPDLSGLLT